MKMTCKNDKRKNIFGYLYRVKKANTYLLCSAGFIVIPNFEDKRYLLCKMIQNETEPCYLCFACENPSVYENMSNLEMFMKTK